MRIGIDLGGTKIEGIALANDGAELQRLRVPTPRDYDGTLHAIAEVVRHVDAAAPPAESPTPVGVGIPGTEDGPGALIKNANSTWLIGRPLRADLESMLQRPVRLMNDANCFALSEATDGAGTGAHVVFGVILGTGVGGGIVVGGECLIGPNGIAGEWGHNPLPWSSDADEPAPVCYCGRSGCIETYLSGPGTRRDHAARSGEDLSTHEIVERAAAGDEAAAITMRHYHDRLGRALASVVNVLDPDVIVLGGGMSNLPGLADAAFLHTGRYVFSGSFNTRIRRNMHGDSSGVRGAAWLWPPSPR
jgi:fructokinase